MTESTTGLILRTRPLTETSLIIHWLTPDLGRLATVAKGARRPNSPFRGKLDLFYLASFSFARSRRSELHTLREATLQETHSALRRDFSALRQLCYAAALIEQATETETPLPEIYELMSSFVTFLSSHPAEVHFVYSFELKLLTELGLEPDIAETRLSAGARALIRALAQSTWESLPRIKPSAAQSTELKQLLHGFIIFHLGRIPAGRPVH